jgi:glycosyltransferase involved in cell wall biosynthesis
MKSQYRISIVIPTHARATPLARCIASLTQQTLPPFEIILVAAKKELYLSSIKAAFPSLPIRVVHVDIPSYSHTRNTGIKHARGDIITLIDDDCIADTRWLENISRAHRTPHIVVAGIGYLNADPSNLYSTLHNLRNREGLLYQLTLSDKKQTIGTSSYPHIHMIDNKNVSFPKSVIRLFPELYASWLPSYICADDCELANRLNQQHIPIVYHPEIVIHHAGRKNLFSLLQRSLEYGKSDWWTTNIEKETLTGLQLKTIDIWLIRMARLPFSLFQKTRILLHIVNILIHDPHFSIISRFYGVIVYIAMKMVRSSGYLYETIHHPPYPNQRKQHGANDKKRRATFRSHSRRKASRR